MWDAFWNAPRESPGIASGPCHGHMGVFAFHHPDGPGSVNTRERDEGARLCGGPGGKGRGGGKKCLRRCVFHLGGCPAQGVWASPGSAGGAGQGPCVCVRVCVCARMHARSVNTFLPHRVRLCPPLLGSSPLVPFCSPSELFIVSLPLEVLCPKQWTLSLCHGVSW